MSKAFTRPAPPVVAPDPSASAFSLNMRDWGLAEFFIVSQTAIPALLFLPGTQGIRLYVRVASFAISIGLALWWAFGDARGSRRHPSQPWLAIFLIYTGLMILHPFTSSALAGLAQLVLYVAVMAPVFWAPAVVRNPDHLARLMTILLICNGVNAFVGVMQVYDPGRWMPQEMSRIVTESEFGLGAVSYRGPDGKLIIRPPGLFDNPGAVAGPAMYAALLGLVFATSASAMWTRGLAMVGAGAGAAAIYLSQVRVSLVVLAMMLATYAFVLSLQQRKQRAFVFGTFAGAMVVGAFALALGLGGQSIAERTFTLFAQDPVSLYSASRGDQLSYGFRDLLADYPLGAGLGRWGMIAGYFGGGDQPPMWAEIQISGWGIDGGLPLVVLGIAAPVVALLSQLKIALYDVNAKVRACAAIALAANLGTAALIFSFTPFVTQIGLQFWFLSGAVQAVATPAVTRPRAVR
jgi:hypothetical protein